jgi:phage regulator Rha-like protein/phage antirepressor YoqD-like protein
MSDAYRPKKIEAAGAQGDTAMIGGFPTRRNLPHTDPVQMTSREIAELTGKQHKDVLYDTRRMLEDLGKAEADFSATAWGAGPNGSSRPYPIFNLPKDLTLTLVSGYSVQMRHRIITRWQELEAQATQYDPMRALGDPATLRQALLGYTEMVIQLEQQVDELAPKAIALDRIGAARDGITITRAAKDLKVNPQGLFTLMAECGWIYKREGSTVWSAYQRRIDDGCLFHRVATIERPDGTPKLVEQVLVAPKGLVKLAKLIGGAA